MGYPLREPRSLTEFCNSDEGLKLSSASSLQQRTTIILLLYVLPLI